MMTKAEEKVFNKHLMDAMKKAISIYATSEDIDLARELSDIKTEMEYALENNKKVKEDATPDDGAYVE